MKSRCYNKNHSKYDSYGGRGIKVCDRWLEDSVNFYADMGPRPSQKHSLDRIDVNGDYCPENCRWATPKEQGNNRRNNHKVLHNGEEKTLSEIETELGLNYNILSYRINQNWSIEDAINIPPRKRSIKLNFDGKSLTIPEWAQKLGIKEQTIRIRLTRGWTVEETLGKPLQNGRWGDK